MLRWTRGDRRVVVGTEGVVMQVTLRTDGEVEVWLNKDRPSSEVARVLREMADGFENNPRRVG